MRKSLPKGLSRMGLPQCSDEHFRTCWRADALPTFGRNGYARESPVEKWIRDAKLMQTYEGTNQAQRLGIAREWLNGQAAARDRPRLLSLS